MNIYSIIKNKRNGHPNNSDEITYMINSYMYGKIPDYQMSAWLMAIFLKGMNLNETIHYTNILKKSGKQLDFTYLPGPVIDKHSTGGVGDKISLILGPILAACGCFIPMIAGRGLGHTGGTIDKLESITGYNTKLSLNKFKKNVEKIGISIIEQTDEICPADGKIYSLRDVTATIESFPLICGSILSKKISEGIETLILDIKWGNGAFVETIEEAIKLGELLSLVGMKFNIHVEPCYTGMHQPLGNNSGLWCEIIESYSILNGEKINDIMEVILHLGNAALKLSGIKNPKNKILDVINNGKALEIFMMMIEEQSGKCNAIVNNDINQPKYKKEIKAKKTGFISSMSTKQIGISLIEIGAGRKRKRDTLDYSAGITFNKKCGSKVNKGDIIAQVYCSNKSKLDIGSNIFDKSIFITKDKKDKMPLIYKGKI